MSIKNCSVCEYRDYIRKTGTLVTEINQRAGVVTVKTATDSYKADACICTAPTNSLLKIKLNPPLPSAQTEAAAQSLIR